MAVRGEGLCARRPSGPGRGEPTNNKHRCQFVFSMDQDGTKIAECASPEEGWIC